MLPVVHIISQAAEIDRALTEIGYSLFSNEGRILFNAIRYDGSMIKIVAAHPLVSPRSAFSCIRRLEDLALLTRMESQTDARAFVINVDLERISKMVEVKSENVRWPDSEKAA
jgi:hypothetical protein